MNMTHFLGLLYEAILTRFKTPRRKKALKDVVEYNLRSPQSYTCVYMLKYGRDTRKWYRDHLYSYYKHRSKGYGYTPTPFKTLAVLNNTSALQERRQFLNFMRRTYNV